MSYGICVVNDAGQTVIDSRRDESLLYAGTANTMSGPNLNPTFPTSGWTGSSLILARPQSSTGNQVIGRGFGGTWAQTQVGGADTTWRELRAQSEDSLTPSGYGLVVYNDAGTDVLMSATDLDATAELVGTGKFNGSTGTGSEGLYHVFNMDPALDKGRYYVLATNTISMFGVKPTWQLHIDYKFDYANSQIRIQNYYYETVTIDQSRDMEYAIFYVRNGGATDDNFA